MVLERTLSPYDVQSFVIDAFGNNNLSLVMTNDTIVLTRNTVYDKFSETTLVSENSLAKDWLLSEEDEAWKDL